MTTSPIADYRAFLETVLTPARLAHSLGCMTVMGELAEIYALAPETARLVGLLHDAAKDLPRAEIDRIVREGPVEIGHPYEWDYVHYLHGPVGAHFVRRELGISDPTVLDAIEMHTYYGAGESFHAPLTWCMRFADLLEPNRDFSQLPWIYDRAPHLRELVYGGKMWKAATLQLHMLIDFFSATGRPVHPNMRHALDYTSGNSPPLVRRESCLQSTGFHNQQDPPLRLVRRWSQNHALQDSNSFAPPTPPPSAKIDYNPHTWRRPSRTDHANARCARR